MPRFTRTLLFLSVLSLLVLPTGKAEAQSSGELEGTLTAGTANTCTVGTTEVDGQRIPVTTEHERCTGGSFGDIGLVAIEATRDIGPDVRTATCAQDPAGDPTIPFTTRENTAGGRGRVGPASLALGTGTVVDPGGAGQGPCIIRITGAFHRVATYAFGRLVIDVHVDTGNPARDFRHWYCARFYATAVPTVVGGTQVAAEVVGRQPCRVEEERDDDNDIPVRHGRDPADNGVLEHDAFHH